MPQHHKETTFPIEFLGLAAAAGVFFCAVHLFNGWLFASLEISPHISFIYLPNFLRLANVLLLGMVWGTLGTAIGCLLLIAWSPDNFWVSLANATVSTAGATLSVFLMRFMQKRELSLVRLSDLISLALLYAVVNSLMHHAMWSVFDPSQLVNPNQLVFMMLGDLNGAVIGALVLRWLANHTQMVQFASKRASTAPINNESKHDPRQ
ncbi:hypothetical protein MCEMAEM4_00677 [Burkholderiaceae bacterium]